MLYSSKSEVVRVLTLGVSLTLLTFGGKVLGRSTHRILSGCTVVKSERFFRRGRDSNGYGVVPSSQSGVQIKIDFPRKFIHLRGKKILR